MAVPVPVSKFPLSPNVTTTNTTMTTTKLLFFAPKPLGSFKPLRSSSSSTEPTEEDPGPVNPVKTALAKAEAYRKSKKSTSGESDGNANHSPEVPASAKLAMEKAREYKKNKGQEKMNVVDTGEDLLKSKVNKEELTISSIDFLGFGFSEKKSYRGMPPGLTPAVEPLLDGEIPEVEFIVGDASKFEVASPQRISSDGDTNSTDLYKPKVSTWGVFPRPNNISKTSDLHGLAALQWSICQDSLRRPKEARAMYEKLQSHSNVLVSKKARQFVFSFQAMDMMKVSNVSLSKETGYENYFDAFIDKKAEYTPTEVEENKGTLQQAFLYIMFLASPVLFVAFIAIMKTFELHAY